MDPLKDKKLNWSAANIRKEQSWKSIGNYLLEGAFTADELRNRLNPSDIPTFEQMYKRIQLEQEKKEAKRRADELAQQQAEAARKQKEEQDNNAWAMAQFMGLNGNMEAFNNYLAQFPDGLHVEECKALLNDPAWFIARQTNSAAAFREYMQTFPGRHDEECQQYIELLKEDEDWANAKTEEDINAYLQTYPEGKYVREANARLQQIIEAIEKRKIVLNQLMTKRDYYSSNELQYFLENFVLTEEDLKGCGYNNEMIESIRNYTRPTPLPDNTPDEKLPEGATEFYFWGTPGSGKTCTLGAILSTANRQGLLGNILEGGGQHYFNLLKGIFKKNSSCILPEGTSHSNIASAKMEFRDEENRTHQATLVDLAGEVFRSMLDMKHGVTTGSPEAARTLDYTLKYLRNKRNHKVHFFLIPYGEEELDWDGMYIDSYLSEGATFLDQQGVFNSSTDGIFILLTKCDRMPQNTTRGKEAERYISENYLSFFRNLESFCQKYKINGFSVISFSIGDVFSKQSCKFDETDSIKVIKKILEKTRA